MLKFARIFLYNFTGVEAGDLEIEGCAMLVDVLFDEVATFVLLDWG